MKKLFLLTSAIILYNLSDAQIKMNSSGWVKIGGTVNPTKNLDVSGNSIFITGVNSLIIDNSGYYGTPAVFPNSSNCGNIGKSSNGFQAIYSYNYINPSDARQKENIRDIKDALNIVLQLKGVKYDIKKEYYFNDSMVKDARVKEKIETQRKNKIGFIAQDVNKVLPEVTIYDDLTDIYGIDYSKVVPVLVEAIKELKNEIETLKSGSKLKSAETTTQVEDISKQYKKSYLEQNIPNPFNQKTIINFYLAESNQIATIYIFDMQGSQKKSYYITAKGKSNITINGAELQAGMYFYTLVVDGKEVDTKKMILTQ